jgi:signal transduction histidine kinase
MSGRPRRWRGVGLRREVVILLPVAFFLLVLLSVFTLFAYRSGVALLVEERRGEALLLAGRIAAEAAAGPLADQDLRRLAPAARGVALLDAGGRTLARTGSLAEAAPPSPPAGATRTEPWAGGPDETLGDVVAALVPVGGTGPSPPAARWVRLELGAPALALQRRGLRVLTALVLGVDAALIVLVALFLGRLLAPYETLLERARSAGAVPPEAADEVAFLVGTFERALAALARPPEAPEGDGIAAFQRTLAASFESGVLLLDPRGRVLALNPPGAQVLEIDPLEIDPPAVEPPASRGGEPEAGRPLGEVLAGHPELAGLLAQAVAEGRGVRRLEIETTTGSGRHLTLGLTVHPLRPGASGGGDREERAGVPSPPGERGERARVRGGDPLTPRGYLVLFVDLTEARRRSEQAHLAESLRQIGELAAGVAHELRNSLATLKGYLTLVERAGRSGGGSAEEGGPAGRSGGAIAEYVAEIRREADHLQRVLEDFLSFARPGTARLEEVDLYQVLARAAADPVLAGVPVRLAPRPPGPLRLSGDPQLLERAFRNLLHNAAEATRAAAPGGVLAEPDRSPEPGSVPGSRPAAGARHEPAVEVAAGAGPEGLEVTVADRGAGVPEELRERLFQPFASGRPGGAGLGLALARRILVLHGGGLALEDRPGGGTVARATLPAGETVTEGNTSEAEGEGQEPSRSSQG